MTFPRPTSKSLAVMLGLAAASGLAFAGRAEAQSAPATTAPGAPAATAVPPASTPAVPPAASTTAPAEVPAQQHGKPRHEASRRHHGGMAGYLAILHDQLQITPAEEPLWTTFADAMQQNARNLAEAYRQRRAQLPSMNAIADMNSFINLEQLRLDGLKKSSTAFGALYQAMPPDQQKLADTVFLSDMPGAPHHRARAKSQP